ncbi:MAG: class I SAM-dependent methyltransferase [Phormidesmis sp. FL-bin-119]|nr:class I SAM-dependent methyltransferase [Pedobacter sp.]
MDKINASSLDEISSAMISRYSNRYRELGYDVKTLGWGNEEQQFYRFSQALEGLGALSTKSVLDIGCGFGDLLKLLIASRLKPKSYTGWDINPDLIEEAKTKWIDYGKSAKFEVHNLAGTEEKNLKVDVAFMFGLLNLNFHDKVDNYTYSYQLISKAFEYVNEVLVVDFISDRIASNYPKEDFIFYHNPVKILEFALSLSPKVEIKHQYHPIPQREFMLYIYK